MPMHTITAMFHSRAEADHAATALREDASLSTTNVKVLPEEELGETGRQSGGFMQSLRHFFMPEEDRHGFAEGMRRGDTMVAVDADEAHGQRVMDMLEHAGAIDLDAEEARWRSEGWRGYEPSNSATPGAMAAGSGPAGTTTGGTIGEQHAATIPPVPGSAAATASGTATTGSSATRTTAADTSATGRETMAGAGIGGTGVADTGLGRTGTVATDSEERIPLVEEHLRVGKRQVTQGRVRIRSFVVETPVNETVHLRDERVEVERRPADRPLTGSEADLFREREIEATESREEAVVSKDARVREELVLHKSVEERDETVHDTVRHTEIEENRGEDMATGTTGTRDRAANGRI